MLTLLRLETEFSDDRAAEGGFPLPDRVGSMCRLATGRSALFQLTRRLPQPHASTVLLPCYVAEGVIKPFVAAGFSVCFYPLTEDLQPDEDAVASLLGKISGRAVFVLIHYFGFSAGSASLMSLLSASGTLVVSDCAHAPLSRNEDGVLLGDLGDVALYSLNKWLPVCDGAILVCRSGEFSVAIDEDTLPSLPPMATDAFLDHLAACRALFSEPDPAKAILHLEQIGSAYETYYAEINNNMEPHRQGDMSRRIEAVFPYKDSAQIRRRHAEHLLSGMRSDLFKPVFTSLPPGIVPFCIPARVPANRRQDLLNALIGRGILLSTLEDKWDFVPSGQADSFAVERAFLREHVLIPVSEFLTEKDMTAMIADINQLQ